MITILPADNEAVSRYASAENSAYDRAMVMTERGEELGHMLYAVNGETVWLGRVICQEKLLADGLLRGVLNAAQNAGCHTAVSPVKEDHPFLKTYGFREKDETVFISIGGFFSGGCKGCSGDCKNCGK